MSDVHPNPEKLEKVARAIAGVGEAMINLNDALEAGQDRADLDADDYHMLLQRWQYEVVLPALRIGERLRLSLDL